MRKLVAITASLSLLALVPMASAQTTGQPSATTTQSKKSTPSPKANTTTVPKSAGSGTDAKGKPDRMARKATGKVRHARHHQRVRMYGYRTSGKRHQRSAKLGDRARHHRHRVMGYRATGCR
jgi:hypothetical protein